MKKLLLSFAILFAASTVLVSCGEDEKKSDSSGDATPKAQQNSGQQGQQGQQSNGGQQQNQSMGGQQQNQSMGGQQQNQSMGGQQNNQSMGGHQGHQHNGAHSGGNHGSHADPSMGGHGEENETNGDAPAPKGFDDYK